MTNDDTKTPDPFGPEDYAAVKTSIVQAFGEATAAGRIGCATEAEAAQILKEGLEQLERTHGLNVVPFPEQPARRSTADTEGGEA